MSQHKKSPLWIQYPDESSRAWIHASKFSVSALFHNAKHTQSQTLTRAHTHTHTHAAQSVMKSVTGLSLWVVISALCFFGRMFLYSSMFSGARHGYSISIHNHNNGTLITGWRHKILPQWPIVKFHLLHPCLWVEVVIEAMGIIHSLRFTRKKTIVGTPKFSEPNFIQT